MRIILYSMVCWSVVITSMPRCVSAENPENISATVKSASEVTTNSETKTGIDQAATTENSASRSAGTSNVAVNEDQKEQPKRGPQGHREDRRPKGTGPRDREEPHHGPGRPGSGNGPREGHDQSFHRDDHRLEDFGPYDKRRGPQFGSNGPRGGFGSHDSGDRHPGPGDRPGHKFEHRDAGRGHQFGHGGSHSEFGPHRFNDRHMRSGGSRHHRFGHRNFGPHGRARGPQFGHSGPRGGFGHHRFGHQSWGGRGHGPHQPLMGDHSPQFGHSPGRDHAGPPASNRQPSPERAFEELDANKDGMISKEEFLKRHVPSDARRDDRQSPGSRRPEFSRPGLGRPGFGGPGFDRPGQGPGPGAFGPPSVETIFDRVDRNHDGKVTKDEAPDFMWSRLSEADTDQDGAVSKKEMEKHIQKHRPGQKPESRDNRPGEEKPKSAAA